MKKKFITLLSAVMLLSVGFNTTSCNKDDDEKQEIKDAAAQGKEDGIAFANAYQNIKASYQGGGVLDAISKTSDATTIVNNAKKYKSSEDKVYKAEFIAGASGVAGWAEGQAEKILEGIDVNGTTAAIQTLINLFK